MRSVFRAGLAVMVLLGAAYFFALPVHTYLGQKSAVGLEQKTISVLQAENAKLVAERKALNSASTLEQIARQDYGLVKPGQQAFMVLPSAAAPAPAKSKQVRAHHHWYSDLELWRSL